MAAAAREGAGEEEEHVLLGEQSLGPGAHMRRLQPATWSERSRAQGHTGRAWGFRARQRPATRNAHQGCWQGVLWHTAHVQRRDQRLAGCVITDC